MNLPNPMDLIATGPVFGLSNGSVGSALDKIKELTRQVQDLRAENARLRQLLSGGKPE